MSRMSRCEHAFCAGLVTCLLLVPLIEHTHEGEWVSEPHTHDEIYVEMLVSQVPLMTGTASAFDARYALLIDSPKYELL